jgi:cytochrome c biogenesis protein CcdA
MGLAFGAGPCNIACLPYLGPVFTAAGEAGGRGRRVMAPFSLGRLAGYTALGLGAGAAGRALVAWLEGAPVHALLGAATAAVGLTLLRRRSRTGPGCGSPRRKGPVPGQGGGLFLMGAGMALNPCLPLGTLLLAAAATGSPWAGLALGAAFGAGAILVPALVFGLGIAHLGHQIRRHAGSPQRLERISALLLVALGAATATGWITP